MVRRHATGRLRAAAIFYAAAGVLTLFFLGPFIWTVISSLKQPSEITTYPPIFIPSMLRFENYAQAWTKVPFLTFYLNSAIVAGLAVTGQVISATRHQVFAAIYDIHVCIR